MVRFVRVVQLVKSCISWHLEFVSKAVEREPCLVVQSPYESCNWCNCISLVTLRICKWYDSYNWWNSGSLVVYGQTIVKYSIKTVLILRPLDYVYIENVKSRLGPPVLSNTLRHVAQKRWVIPNSTLLLNDTWKLNESTVVERRPFKWSESSLDDSYHLSLRFYDLNKWWVLDTWGLLTLNSFFIFYSNLSYRNTKAETSRLTLFK